MIARARRWWNERTTTIRGLQMDLQTLHNELEKLNQLQVYTAATDRKHKAMVDEQHGLIRELKGEIAILELTIQTERENRVRVERDLASLRDRLAEYRNQAEPKAGAA